MNHKVHALCRRRDVLLPAKVPDKELCGFRTVRAQRFEFIPLAPESDHFIAVCKQLPHHIASQKTVCAGHQYSAHLPPIHFLGNTKPRLQQRVAGAKQLRLQNQTKLSCGTVCSIITSMVINLLCIITVRRGFFNITARHKKLQQDRVEHHTLISEFNIFGFRFRKSLPTALHYGLLGNQK